jgi:hypothetical protein
MGADGVLISPDTGEAMVLVPCDCGSSVPATLAHADAKDLVECKVCGRLWAVALLAGRIVAQTPYEGDVSAAVERLTAQFGPAVARQRFADPHQALAYSAAWHEFLRWRATRHWARRLPDTVVSALFRLSPKLQAFAARVFPAKGGE